MKKALNLILIYIITIIIGSAIGTVLYSFYLNVLDFIAGTEIQFFTKKDLISSFFYTAICLLFFICPIISYYRIRHPGGMPQIITFVFLALLTWAVAIPGLFHLSKKYIQQDSFVTKNECLSKGYFREVDDKVYYFVKDAELNQNGKLETTAVIINTNPNGNVSIEKVVDSPDSDLRKAAEPYKEILLKNTFQKNELPFSLKLNTLIENCNSKVNGTIFTIIGYLSLGLIMASVFALTNVFKWKLLNTLFISIVSISTIIINANPGLIPFYFIEEKLAGSGFMQFLSNFGSNPLLVFSNFLFALIFISIGVIQFIIRKHKSKRSRR